MAETSSSTIEIPSSQPSTSQEPSPSHTRRELIKGTVKENVRKRKPHEPERDEKNRLLFYCKHCSYAKTGNTNFKSHVKNHHGIDCFNSKPQLAQSKDASHASYEPQIAQVISLISDIKAKGGMDDLKKALFEAFTTKEEFEELLVRLIVVHSLSFSAVEWEELRALCQLVALAPLPSRRTITARIHSTYQKKRDIVREILLASPSKIQLSVDIWSSPNHLLWLGVIAQFVDQKKQEVTHGLIDMINVSGHSGESQWKMLKPTLRDLGVIRKLGAITADNSGTNDTLCNEIDYYLACESRINTTWGAKTKRIRCLGHIINLVVKAFLFKDFIDDTHLQSYDEQNIYKGTDSEIETRRNTFRKLGPLGRLHNIAVHARASSHRTKRFKELVDRLLPLDNATRWNSWYAMLEVATEKESLIDAYVKEHLDTLKSDLLSSEDWIAIHMVKKFLQPFKSATLVAQGDRGLLHEALYNIDILNRHISRHLIRNKEQTEFQKRCKNAYSVLTRYRNLMINESPLYSMALALHPSYRMKYFTDNWSRVDATNASWKRSLQNLYEKYKQEISPPDYRFRNSETSKPKSSKY